MASDRPGLGGLVFWEEHGRRARHLFRLGVPDKTATAPTVEEFRARYIREHCEASRLKPSTIAQKNVILDHYIKSRLGDRRLDQIRDPDIAQLNGRER